MPKKMNLIKKSLLYDMLTNSRYRSMRYIGLLLLLLLFSIVEIMFNYESLSMVATPIKNPQGVGAEVVTVEYTHNTTALIILIANCFLWKVVGLIVLLSFLINKYLKQKHIGQFFLSLVILTLSFVTIQYIFEGIICKYFGIKYFRLNGPIGYVILDIFVINSQWLVTVISALVGKAVNNWSQEAQIRQEQHTQKLKMESSLVKQHISPDVLCTTLHKCGEQAASGAETVSTTLLKLSRVLRYQLYDSRRDYSLMKSEVDFVREYLELLQFNGICKSFSINIEGPIMNVTVPPLVFSLMMQYEKPVDNIDCRFVIDNESVRFTISDGRRNVNLNAINTRLTPIYGNRYIVSAGDGTASLTIPTRVSWPAK